MSDFHNFANLARAAFPRLNVSVLMYEKATATGIHSPVYRLKATGNPFPEAITADGNSPADAVARLRRAVAQQRRAIAAIKVRKQLRGIAPGLTTDQLNTAEQQLLACPYEAFDGLAANLLHAAREANHLQQAA